MTKEQQLTERSVHVSYSQAVEVHHKKIAKIVNRYAHPQASVLDFGCGTGVTLQLLHKERPDIKLFGADMDPICLQRTKKRVEDVTTIELDEKGLRKHSFGQQFDVCILAHVLEHVHHPLKVVNDALELTKPDGYLVLVTPNPVRPDVILNSLRRKHYVNRGHVHAWDRSHWMNFTGNIAGLNVIKYDVDEVRIIPGKLKRKFKVLESFNISLARLIPWWSFSNIAIVQNN